MNEVRWIKCSDRLPPENIEVMTKIHDKDGIRNEQALCRIGKFWVIASRGMYVYYAPTHWRFKEEV